MNDENNPTKQSPAKIFRKEKGWRKSMANAQIAQENVHRLKTLEEVLLSRLTSLEARKQHVMKVAVEDGIFTDHMRDGVCEQLVAEGWLIRADPLRRRHSSTSRQVYLSTEKADQDWNPTETE